MSIAIIALSLVAFYSVVLSLCVAAKRGDKKAGELLGISID